MKTQISTLAFMAFLVLGTMSCSTYNDKNNSDANNSNTVINVDAVHFTSANANIKVKTVGCTLSNGAKTKCFQILTNSTPTDHPMGPWCPDNISDDASAGGIWFDQGEVYDVDGEFIKKLASFYDDSSWQMYDANGKIFVTETEEDCVNAANPNVGEEYKNFCVECLPSYITDVSQTWLIPVTPVLQTNPAFFGRGHGGPRETGRTERPRDHADRPDRPRRPGGPGKGIPASRGIALNGVEFSAPAPVNNILGAYTLAPFDDAGGHINVHQGYHYHAATGLSFSIEQNDGHAPLIGYAMDGHGIYARTDKRGDEPIDLDDCRGHYDEIRGYHYHVDGAGNNNFINCLQGAFAL